MPHTPVCGDPDGIVELLLSYRRTYTRTRSHLHPDPRRAGRAAFCGKLERHVGLRRNAVKAVHKGMSAETCYLVW